jgi:multiple sugar transport system permease protein
VIVYAKLSLGRKIKIKINHFFYSIRHMRLSTLIILTLLTGVALVSLLPIVYVICNAFKPLEELFIYPPQFFVKNPTMQNFWDFIYATDVSTVPFTRYLFNSVVVTVTATALIIVVSLCCAYAFSKLKFPGQNGLFKMITVALMFSPEAVVITRYLIVSELHIIDTFWAHILPHLALPMGVFLIKQFMDQVPDSLLEAAQLEGANAFSIYLKIILPMVKPAIATGAILSFQQVWNNTETSSLFTSTESIRTLAFYMNTLSGVGTVQGQGMAAAAALIMFVPNLLLFIVSQSSVMNTMAHSGLK